MQTIEFTGVNDLLNAVSGAIADRDARIATLEALLAERPAPADPAVLALAMLGAMVYAGLCVPEFSGDESAADGRDVMDVLQEFRQSSGVGPFLPGIADAIAALLAPDGAASEGVTG